MFHLRNTNPTFFHEHVESVYYSINGVKCDKANISALMQRLLSAFDSIKLEKGNNVVDFYQHDKKYGSYYFDIEMNSNIIRNILESGKENYKKLIDLLLHAVDSGFTTGENFGDNFQEFEKDLREYLNFYNSFRLNRNHSLYHAALAAVTETNTLISVFMLLNQSIILNSKNLCDRDSGNISSLEFFFDFSYLQNDYLDIEELNKLFRIFLEETSAIEESIIKDYTLKPNVKSFALYTLKELEQLSQKFTKTCNDYFDAEVSMLTAKL